MVQAENSAEVETPSDDKMASKSKGAGGKDGNRPSGKSEKVFFINFTHTCSISYMFQSFFFFYLVLIQTLN